MPRKSSEPLTARHIELYDSDWEFLNVHFGRGSAQPIGAGRLVRDIVRKKVRQLKEHQAQRVDGLAQAREAE